MRIPSLRPAPALLGLLALLGGAPAQEPDRDPFAPPPALAQGTRGADRLGPKPILRGYGQRADGVALALLELSGGETVLVRRGARIEVPGSPHPVLLEVVEISGSAVRLVSPDGGIELEL